MTDQFGHKVDIVSSILSHNNSLDGREIFFNELSVSLNSLQGKYAEFMSAYIGLELLLQGQKT